MTITSWPAIRPIFHHLSLLEKIDMATRLPSSACRRDGIITGPPRPVRPPQPPYSPYTPITLESTVWTTMEMKSSTPTSRSPLRPPRCSPRSLPCRGAFVRRHRRLEELAAFIQWAQARQITVLATFPNVVYQPDYGRAGGTKDPRDHRPLLCLAQRAGRRHGPGKRCCRWTNLRPRCTT